MSEPENVEFHERIERPIVPGRLARGGIVLGAAVLFVVGAVAAMGASPSPAPSTTGASPSPAASGAPDTDKSGDHGLRGFGGFGFGRGGFGFGGITITAISGSNLSLETEDGWTRTIAVTSDTTITRAGTTIAFDDLKVGDQIVFRQDRQDRRHLHDHGDHVVLPSIAAR